MLLSWNFFSTIKAHKFLSKLQKPPICSAEGTIEPFKGSVKGIVKLVLTAFMQLFFNKEVQLLLP